MSELHVKKNVTSSAPKLDTPLGTKASWEKPKLEDVSEQVMAQPYIRFT